MVRKGNGVLPAAPYPKGTEQKNKGIQANDSGRNMFEDDS